MTTGKSRPGTPHQAGFNVIKEAIAVPMRGGSPQKGASGAGGKPISKNYVTETYIL
jgi:hypothetical protein